METCEPQVNVGTSRPAQARQGVGAYEMGALLLTTMSIIKGHLEQPEGHR